MRLYTDVTPFNMALTCISLTEVDWSIMILASITQTRTRQLHVTFSKQVEPPQTIHDEDSEIKDMMRIKDLKTTSKILLQKSIPNNF
jgi:hypothetical protein